MTRAIAGALFVSLVLCGGASAQGGSTSSGASRQSESGKVAQSRDRSIFVARRCSGVACLRSVPSLGVAF